MPITNLGTSDTGVKIELRTKQHRLLTSEMTRPSTIIFRVSAHAHLKQYTASDAWQLTRRVSITPREADRLAVVEYLFRRNDAQRPSY